MNAHINKEPTSTPIKEQEDTLIIEEDKDINPDLLHSILDSLKVSNILQQGYQEVAALLQMSDGSFNKIAPIVLSELRNGLKDNNTRLKMAQALNATGVIEQNIGKDLPIFFEALDKELGATISPNKITFLKELISAIVSTSEELSGTKSNVNIPIELCHPEAKIPTYANIGDAGLDLYALEEITVLPGETVLVPTGIKVAIPEGYELQVRPKSGRALKTKLRVANTPGTVDSGYRQEIGVIIENIEPKIADISYTFLEDGTIRIDSILHGKPYYIGKGEKFAQLVLNEVPSAVFHQVPDISICGNDRGGGFGSSGLK